MIARETAQSYADNPDSCSESQLRQLLCFLRARNILWRGTNYAYYTKLAASHLLAWHLRDTLLARKLRATGQIAAAEIRERRAEKHFNQLPNWAKWK